MFRSLRDSFVRFIEWQISKRFVSIFGQLDLGGLGFQVEVEAETQMNFPVMRTEYEFGFWRNQIDNGEEKEK